MQHATLAATHANTPPGELATPPTTRHTSHTEERGGVHTVPHHILRGSRSLKAEVAAVCVCVCVSRLPHWVRQATHHPTEIFTKHRSLRLQGVKVRGREGGRCKGEKEGGARKKGGETKMGGGVYSQATRQPLADSSSTPQSAFRGQKFCVSNVHTVRTKAA
ncbi:hypothetical protein E2C01_084894 [Portunus trituberculatus]|uniref:Uncharacterized protein n=1 Tax=Portunus trituberculatus TaxID=210409 RepID=A0A5B7IZH6_PORTR|nr:hypothetical protein [Portunus trituberculatus]